MSIYDYQLSTSCTIALVPGSPVAWQFLTSGEIYKGIRRGSPDDLRSKVRCVFLVDRYGNMIPRDSDQPTPLLQLQWNHITVIGGEETVPNGVDAEVEAEECDEMEEVVESTQQTKDGSRKRGRRGNEIVKSKKKQKLSVDSTSILLEPSVIRLSDSDYSSESSRLGGHVDHTPMSMDEEFLHDFACWTISPTASLADIPKEVEFVRLNVSDLESAFRPSSEAHWIALKAGLPHFLYISIPSLHVPEPCPSVTVEVAADTKIHYVQAHLYDLSGKPSSAEDITHIEIELVAPNDQKFTLKRTNNHSVYSLHMLNMAQTQRDSSNSFTPLSQIVGSPSNASQGISYLPKDPYTIEYTCKGSYQLQSSAIVHLEPAILTCHIIQLNAVVELSLCTISCATDSQPDECQINEIPLEDDERVLTMTCDHFLPEFWLTNKTANGTPFVLPVESLKCTIKPFKCAKSKKVIEFSKLYNMVSLEAEENSAESEVENEPGIRFYLLDDNKTVGSCFSPGKYAFTITYTEERAELKELLNPKKVIQ